MKNSPTNLYWSNGEISYEDRCEFLKQKGLVIWFTGISASGKSTISVEVEKKLINSGFLAYRLDGDNLRYGLNSDLSFSKEHRDENIRRIAEVAGLFKEAGVVTLVSSISPYRSMRSFARSRVESGSFIEIYVKADLQTCIKRDPKGLYKKALSGEISNFTGVSSVYEEPLEPEMIIDTSLYTIEDASDLVFEEISKRQVGTLYKKED